MAQIQIHCNKAGFNQAALWGAQRLCREHWADCMLLSRSASIELGLPLDFLGVSDQAWAWGCRCYWRRFRIGRGYPGRGQVFSCALYCPSRAQAGACRAIPYTPLPGPPAMEDNGGDSGMGFQAHEGLSAMGWLLWKTPEESLALNWG